MFRRGVGLIIGLRALRLRLGHLALGLVYARFQRVPHLGHCSICFLPGSLRGVAGPRSLHQSGLRLLDSFLGRSDRLLVLRLARA